MLIPSTVRSPNETSHKHTRGVKNSVAIVDLIFGNLAEEAVRD